MDHKTNGIERFWQELKRRKVFGVVTTYVATAYIIIEVINNLTTPLHLPDWFSTLIVLILAVGLPVAVILSWFFDFTPTGIIKTESVEEGEIKETLERPVKRRMKLSYILNAALLIVVAVILYPKIIRQDTLEKLRAKGKISVAVMPFQNMTNDTIWNVWQNGIQNELISSLTNCEELKVRQTETISSLILGKGLANFTSITPSVARKLSQKLDANIFVYGTIKQAGPIIRLNAQLFSSNTNEALRSYQINGTSDKILSLIDTLGMDIMNSIVISRLEKNVTSEFQSFGYKTSSEAYRNFIYGQTAFFNGDYSTAIPFLSQALDIDSNLIYASFLLAFANLFSGNMVKAKEIVLQTHKKREQISSVLWEIYTDYQYAFFFQTPLEQIKYLRQSLQIDDQLPFTNFDLGKAYLDLHQYDKAIPEFERALKIYKRWNTKPSWVWNYTPLGLAYNKTAQYKKEKKLYRKAEKDFPENADLIYRQAILSMTVGDTLAAIRYIEKYKSICIEKSSSDAEIMTGIANIYSEANIPEKAREHFKQALSIEPENPDRINNLSYCLIDNGLSINEGLELIEKAIKIGPYNFSYLDSKGLGLYKLGNYQNACELLQKSWDLRRQFSIYDHTAFLHLEEAKKAVAGMK